MKNSNILFLQIFTLSQISGIVFFLVTLYWYNDYESIKGFIESFLVYKNIIVIFFIFLFSLGVSIVSKLLFGHIFLVSENNNKKLKEYNHFVAHELKTPISVMYSNFQVLEHGYDSSIIKKSLAQLKDMVHIIDGLLNFSESLQVSENSDINVEKLIRKVMSSLDNRESITIYNSSFNVSIYSDEILFFRVVGNLLSNALKYSSDGNCSVYISPDELVFKNAIDTTLSNKEIRHLQERSFSKSFEEKRGHGIGLVMLSKIVLELGFSMNISSIDNTFIVEIKFS